MSYGESIEAVGLAIVAVVYGTVGVICAGWVIRQVYRRLTRGRD